MHLLPISNDNDNDYIADSIEYYFGLDSTNSDTDDDGVLDGVQLAMHLWKRIDSLPNTIQDSTPYVKFIVFWSGSDTCPICGDLVPQGFIEIINPLKSLSDDIPFIGYHFLEYGGFRYENSVSGDIDPIKLDSALNRN